MRMLFYLTQNSMTTFKTSDLATASLLLMKRFEIQEISRGDPKRTEFIFKDTESLHNTIKQLQDGKLQVHPIEYFEAIKKAKRFIYS